MTSGLSRRSVLAGSGALILSFTLLSKTAAQSQSARALPGSLAHDPRLESWLRIDSNGKVTVFTGKAELGQGIKTALIQMAAEELDIEPDAIRLITADTTQTPDEGYTAGSRSIETSGTAIRQAAAYARALLMQEAARQLNIQSEQLRTENGAVLSPDGRRLGYGALVSDTMQRADVRPAPLKQPAQYRLVGKSLPRVDIPAKVTGGTAYVHDLRLPGMVHGRVIRPPSYGARLISIDETAVKAMPGVIAVVRDGSFLAVVAEQEHQAVEAMRQLETAARWQETAKLPTGDLAAFLKSQRAEVGIVAQAGAPPAVKGRTFKATFTRAYQMHGSIGPSCAVGLLSDGRLTVWSHTQGAFPDRAAIAEMLGMKQDDVRVVHMEGSGCYGHNGADDAAADAALIARAVPGRPVRVQWMREQEHGWEPYGPAMAIDVEASLDAAGHIASWRYALWSNAHTTRPGPAGSLLAAQSLSRPFPAPTPRLSISPAGTGDRNADPPYQLPHKDIRWHFLPDMPVRVSALRALGAYANVFAIESTMDELALLAGADPVAFRLAHISDPRARDVITMTADRFGWTAALKPGRGRGIAFSRYKNMAAYLAVAVEVEVEPKTGKTRVIRAVSAIDAGQAINPDGLKNQTEGGILQSMSWTLFEAVAFDNQRITSADWATYPILRFEDLPESVDVHVINRPGAPPLGAGEAAHGPMAAAIGNAVRHATGKRPYNLPFITVA